MNDTTTTPPTEQEVCGSTDTKDETPCRNPAGAGTSHKGVGKCWRHQDSQASAISGRAQQVAAELGLPLKPLIALTAGVFIGSYVIHFPEVFGDVAKWLLIALGGGRALTRTSAGPNPPSVISGENLDILLYGAAIGWLAVWWPHNGIDLFVILDEWTRIA